MKQKWPHQEGAAAWDKASHFLDPAPPLGYVALRDLATSMRAREHTDGPIVRAAVVQMKADRKHPLKYFRRGLDVGHASLRTPGTIPSYMTHCVDGNRDILVPADFPIGVRCLVEEQGTNWHGAGPDTRVNQFANASINGQRANDR